jgi:hypothetical protein
MTSPEASELGTRLDEHHAPETNGRMAICRRCGGRTVSPLDGKHALDEHQLSRAVAWLDTQSLLRRVVWAREFIGARTTST